MMAVQKIRGGHVRQAMVAFLRKLSRQWLVVRCGGPFFVRIAESDGDLKIRHISVHLWSF